MTWIVTEAEVGLAERLGLPSPIAAGPLASKANMRRLLAELDVIIPAGRPVADTQDLLALLRAMAAAAEAPRAAVLKLDAGLAGMGNAVLNLAPIALDRAASLDQVLAEARLESRWYDTRSFATAFARAGGVAEALIEGPDQSSPSVQIHIDAHGVAALRSIHGQVLAGPNLQSFVGVELPARPEDGRAALGPAMTIANALAVRGVRGDVSVDFVAIGPPQARMLFAVDVNLRRGGATAPFMTLQGLCPGRFDVGLMRYLTHEGEPRAYVSIDAVEEAALVGTPPGALIARLRDEGLAFDRAAGEGVVLSMAGSVVELGRYGLIAVSRNLDQARRLFERARASLAPSH